MLTVAEVSDRLNISKHAIYRAIARRSLPAFEVKGGRHRYMLDEQAVKSWQTDGDFFAVDRTADLLSDNWMTAAEVAHKARMSVESVRRMAAAGLLVGTRNPGRNAHWRFAERDVEKFLRRKPVMPDEA